MAEQYDSPSRPRTPVSPTTADIIPRAEDVAVPVTGVGSSTPLAHSPFSSSAPGSRTHLPLSSFGFTRRGSLQEEAPPVNLHDLEQVHPQQRISGEVIRDVKTGKHYRVPPHKLPAYSLSHASGPAPRADPVRQHGHGHGFGLAHALPTKEQQDQYRAEKKAGKGKGATTPKGSTTPLTQSRRESLNEGEGTQQSMLEQIREMIREEVTRANRGHAEELKRHVDAVDLGGGNPGGNGAGKKADDEDGANGTGEPGTQLVTRDAPVNVGDSSDSAMTKASTSQGGDGPPALNRDGTITVDPQGAETGQDDGEDLGFPNPWTRFRYTMREPFAEFLGTCILMIFGNGINTQVLLSGLIDPSSPKGSYLSISFGWGIGVGMGVWVAGGISGGMINPAVTIALACFRGFPWKKVPIYIVAQITGAWFGSLLTYGNMINAINIAEGGWHIRTTKTAAFFTTYPADFLLNEGRRISCYFNEFYATAVLLIVILAIGDSNNTPPTDGMAPLVLLWLITGIGATLGWQTAYAVNPARDLGPRIMTWMVGYGSDVWTYDAWYWLWTPTLGSITGALFGCFVYDALIYTGGESPLNKTWRFSDIRWGRASRDKMPAAIDLENLKEQRA